jgi:hypothetical protein
MDTFNYYPWEIKFQNNTAWSMFRKAEIITVVIMTDAVVFVQKIINISQV